MNAPSSMASGAMFTIVIILIAGGMYYLGQESKKKRTSSSSGDIYFDSLVPTTASTSRPKVA